MSEPTLPPIPPAEPRRTLPAILVLVGVLVLVLVAHYLAGRARRGLPPVPAPQLTEESPRGTAPIDPEPDHLAGGGPGLSLAGDAGTPPTVPPATGVERGPGGLSARGPGDGSVVDEG